MFGSAILLIGRKELILDHVGAGGILGGKHFKSFKRRRNKEKLVNIH